MSKRNLFAELTEGIQALAAEREDGPALRKVRIETRIRKTAILKVFALSQGFALGALAGAILSILSLPLTRDFFPLAMLVLTGLCAGVGMLTAAVRLKTRHQHA